VTTVLTNTGVTFGQNPVGSLPTAVSQLQTVATINNYATNVSGLASIGLHNVLIGGIRLAQSRYTVGACSGTAESYYNKVLPNGASAQLPCIQEGYSNSPFGIGLDPAYANNTLSQAFVPRDQYGTVSGSSWLGADSPGRLLPYFIVIPYDTNLPTTVNTLLNQYNWFDRSTAVAELFFVVLNGNSQAWSSVTVTFTTSPGGQIIANAQTLTLFTLPFIGAQEAIYGLDDLNIFIMVMLWALLLGSMVYHAYRCYNAPSWRRYCSNKILTVRVLGSWIIETIVASLLTSTAVAFGRVISSMNSTEALISQASWNGQSFEGDTIKFQASFQATAEQYNLATILAISTGAAMTFKIIFAFSFGRRLGTFHKAFARAAPDLFATGLLVALVFCLFGFVGSVMYGGSVSSWSYPLSAGLALFRELNGEGPTQQMISTAPTFTPIFYGSFYVLVQSCLLVVLFAIVSDSYGNVRSEQQEAIAQAEKEAGLYSPVKLRKLKRGPFSDLLEGFTVIPAALIAVRRYLCGSRRTMRPGKLGSSFLCCAVAAGSSSARGPRLWNHACCCYSCGDAPNVGADGPGTDDSARRDERAKQQPVEGAISTSNIYAGNGGGVGSNSSNNSPKGTFAEQQSSSPLSMELGSVPRRRTVAGRSGTTLDSPPGRSDDASAASAESATAASPPMDISSPVYVAANTMSLTESMIAVIVDSGEGAEAGRAEAQAARGGQQTSF
jgi:Polycystin cation channel